MSTNGKSQIKALMAQIEEMWGHQDVLFERISEANDWDRKHGPDWTFADAPYHLAYCNRDLVARPIEYGRDLPAEEQILFRGPTELNAWNARKFAERPASQTIEETLAQLEASRDEIRRVVAGLTDADLDRTAWFPIQLTGGDGWMTARIPLMFCLTHDWSEFMQLRIHMGAKGPVPSPGITTQYLGGTIAMAFPMFLDREAADGESFTAVFDFSDPGVSPFALRVANGEVAVEPGKPGDADLVLTQSAETFERTFRGITTFPDAIQSGAIQVSDMEGLAKFGALFPMQ
jgi:hypothetical protein